MRAVLRLSVLRYCEIVPIGKGSWSVILSFNFPPSSPPPPMCFEFRDGATIYNVTGKGRYGSGGRAGHYNRRKVDQRQIIPLRGL